jgi:hypothetical protein
VNTEALRGAYSSPDIVRLIKLRRMGFLRDVVDRAVESESEGIVGGVGVGRNF